MIVLTLEEVRLVSDFFLGRITRVVFPGRFIFSRNDSGMVSIEVLKDK